MRERGLGKTTLAVIEASAKILAEIQKPGITVADVLRVFPGAKIVPRKSEFEMYLEAQGVAEADRQAILEETARWVFKDGRWQHASPAMETKGSVSSMKRGQ